LKLVKEINRVPLYGELHTTVLCMKLSVSKDTEFLY